MQYTEQDLENLFNECNKIDPSIWVRKIGTIGSDEYMYEFGGGSIDDGDVDMEMNLPQAIEFLENVLPEMKSVADEKFGNHIQDLVIENKVYHKDFVDGDDKTLLWCDTYRTEQEAQNYADSQCLSTELVGWCYGRSYNLNEQFIREQRECGNVAFYDDSKITTIGDIKMIGSFIIYKGYWFKQLNVGNNNGYAVVYCNDLVSWGADNITDVIDDVKEDMDKYIKGNL